MAFAIAAAFVAILLVLFAGLLSLGTVGIVLMFGPVLGIVVNVVAAVGLSSGRPWARFAMTPMLWIMVVAGLASFAVALLRSSIEIPLGALLGIWALRAKPSEAWGPVPASSAEGTILIVASLVAVLAPLLAPLLLRV